MPGCGTAIDSAAINGTAIDGTAIDGAAIDGAVVDGVVVDNGGGIVDFCALCGCIGYAARKDGDMAGFWRRALKVRCFTAKKPAGGC